MCMLWDFNVFKCIIYIYITSVYRGHNVRDMESICTVTSENPSTGVFSCCGDIYIDNMQSGNKIESNWSWERMQRFVCKQEEQSVITKQYNSVQNVTCARSSVSHSNKHPSYKPVILLSARKKFLNKTDTSNLSWLSS